VGEAVREKKKARYKGGGGVISSFGPERQESTTDIMAGTKRKEKATELLQKTK